MTPQESTQSSLATILSDEVQSYKWEVHVSFHILKGSYDFMFSLLFGALQAVCAYIRSVKLQRLKSQTQRYILYKS